MKFKDAGQRLDNAVLGPSDSRRGFAANIMLGLHPALASWWMASAGLLVVVAGVAFVIGYDGLWWLLPLALVAVAKGVASRRLPEAPPKR